MERIDRWRGCLLGLAIGDAVGASVEFLERGTFPEVTDMNGGGPFCLKKGYYTDDTIMAVCLAQSLVEKKAFDPENQMNRYVNWYEYGYNSPTGVCFDIGGTTAAALRKYQMTGNPYAGSRDSRSSGNGGIMRMAPIPMFYKDMDQVVEYSKKMSSTTHASAVCLSCAEIFARAIKRALMGYDKDYILKDIYVIIESDNCLKNMKTTTLKEGFHTKHINDIKGSGYVLESLEAALWCFFNTDTYEQAVLKATNLGNDTDTTAAIVGQLAGAYYGVEAIPKKWRDVIYNYDELVYLSDNLYILSETN